ncbi:MAG: hypothetical protein AB1413_06665 [Thermodesulfobacteriota bacterium]
MRALFLGTLWVVLLGPAVAAAGGAESAYGLGESEPLASDAAETEMAAPSPAEAALAAPAPEADAPQTFRIRLGSSPEARPAGPAVSGLRYRPAAFPLR